jgi:V-type H+-transporting ATPase subunit H
VHSSQYQTLESANAGVDTVGEVEDIRTPKASPGILEEAARARTFQIDWAVYKQSHFLDDDEYDVISRFVQQRTDEARALFIGEDGVPLFNVFISLLSKVSKVGTLQYLLTVISDLFEMNPVAVRALFHECGKNSKNPSWRYFLNILNCKEDEYVVHQANRILVNLASDGIEPLDQHNLVMYFMWLSKQITSKERDASLLALTSLCKLLRFAPYRRPFYEQGETINALSFVLSLTYDVHIQAQYLSAYCAWVITFDSVVASRLGVDGSSLTKLMVELIEGTRKPKVVRMCLAYFNNLVTVPDKEACKRNGTALVGLNMVNILTTVMSSTLDQEAAADAENLKSELDKIYDEMSSFDEYANEVTSGRLRWSPVHSSARFWRENADRLNEDNHQLLKILIQLLDPSQEAEVLAVAAHDIGQYVTNCKTRGKSNIERLHGKERIMALMSHENKEVQYQALVAVQKLMTSNWSALGMVSSGDQ